MEEFGGVLQLAGIGQAQRPAESHPHPFHPTPGSHHPLVRQGCLYHLPHVPQALLAVQAQPLHAGDVLHQRPDRGVVIVGGQCVQVLVSAAKTWEADCADIEVTSPSPAFLAGLQTMGLSTDNLSTGN